MYKELFANKLLKLFKNHKTQCWENPYVGDFYTLKEVRVDGYFDLEKLAEDILNEVDHV